MARHTRFIPEGGALVEISCRTIQGRLLLRPTRTLRRIVVGILAKALQHWSDIQLHAVVILPNHYHLLLTVPDAYTMARFMTFVNGLFSRKLGVLVGWSGPLWARRYDAILVTDEEHCQVARLRYLLAHGVKEGLVLTPADWPGLHCGPALASDGRLRGLWTDATRAARDRARGRQRDAATYDEELELQLAPLPCWRHLPAEQIARQVQELLDGIVAEGRAQHRRVLGPKRLRRQSPLRRRPAPPRHGPAPWCHAATQAARAALTEARALFHAAYREAARRWQDGDLDAPFPAGCFRPPAPFVAAA